MDVSGVCLGEQGFGGGEVESIGQTYQVVQKLLADNLDHLEGGLGRHRVDEHVTVDTDEVLAIHDAVLILAGGVDDLGRELLALVLDDLGKGVLDGGVVGFHKVAIHKLHRQ